MLKECPQAQPKNFKQNEAQLEGSWCNTLSDKTMMIIRSTKFIKIEWSKGENIPEAC